MKIILSIFFLLLISSCSNSWNNEYQSEYYQDSETKKECLEPENPYDNWSWHYSWYERWTQWNSCTWNSSSFIEWCEEYYSQEEDYEACN